MKKFALILLTVAIATVMNSCIIENPAPPPTACFSTEYQTYGVNEDVIFDNCSAYADSYFWDFGDGYTSRQKYPIHYYSQPGEYWVRLTAYGVSGSHSTERRITVSQPTSLTIRVLFNGTTNPVSDCRVKIYETEDDWFNDVNALYQGNTDASGHITFTDLEPKTYYIDAFKADDYSTGYFSNWNLGNMTDPLTPYTNNAYNVFVEYFYSEGAKQSQTTALQKSK